MNLVLTGEIGVGKTGVCQEVVRLAQVGGLHPRGVLTPPLRDASGAKVGFEALDVNSGHRWLLAHTRGCLSGPRVGPYTFSPAGLQRAIDVLCAAVGAEADLLIVDEIGPLELHQGGGFAPILDELPLDGPSHLLLVVRPALVGELRRRLGDPDVTLCAVTRDNRDILPSRIVQALWFDKAT